MGGLEPAGCRIELCAGTQLTSINFTRGARTVVAKGRFGSLLEGFRVDGTAAITQRVGVNQCARACRLRACSAPD